MSTTEEKAKEEKKQSSPVSHVVFGSEPVMMIRTSNVKKYDLIMISDGKVMPTLQLVMENAARDPQDDSLVLIRLINQQTLRVPSGIFIGISRRGVNRNTT